MNHYLKIEVFLGGRGSIGGVWGFWGKGNLTRVGAVDVGFELSISIIYIDFTNDRQTCQLLPLRR